jgi:hypothetical protein
VLIGRGQCEQAVLVLAGKQAGTGVQGPPGPVEGGVLAAWVAVDDLLDPSPAPIQGVAARRTTWNGSITVTVAGRSSVVAVVKPVNPSTATTPVPSRRSFGRWLSQVVNACSERPWTMPGSRAGPVPSRIPVRPVITVTYLPPRLAWRGTWSPAPVAVTPPDLVVSSIRARLPSARTASLAVFQATLRPQRSGPR